MIKEQYYTFKVIHHTGHSLKDKYINITGTNLHDVYIKVIDICTKEVGIHTVKGIIYEGKNTFELYE